MEANSLHMGPQRRLLIRREKIDAHRLVTGNQQHTQAVKVVETPGYRAEATDGFVTANHLLILGVTVADCLPIFLHDRVTHAFGIVHSGWKGTGIVTKAVEAMAREFGSSAADIVALIGPGIGVCCYSVDEKRAGLFASLYAGSTTNRDGVFYLDLKKANRGLLLESGVETIFDVDLCTCCSLQFGSFRREQAASYTRMLAVMGYF